MPRTIALAAALLIACSAAAQTDVEKEQGSKRDELTVKELIEKIKPSVVTIRVSGRDGTTVGMGTGFIISEDGLVATNLHVIDEGREFSIQTREGRRLPVETIEATDRAGDLALVRVKTEESLPSIPLAVEAEPDQGLRVLAFGNPLGLENSVVEGIVSAVREVEGRRMIQLAMPIQTGNSGGPIVDMQGRARGIVNMKSAVDDNLGFAIPVAQLRPLQESPNPIKFDRWVMLGRIDGQDWKPVFGSKWQQRGGILSARGYGTSFGGRSLCLSTIDEPELPYDVEVFVKLDDESGAAGLAFCSDGKDRHYGFYPSSGRVRLTCFKGPTVQSWEILDDQPSQHYLPGAWNKLRIRREPKRLQCFLNEHLIFDSTDDQLASGQLGLVKFRGTNPDFKGFRVGKDLAPKPLSEFAQQWLTKLDADSKLGQTATRDDVAKLSESDEASSRAILQRARQLKQQAEELEKLAADVRTAPTLNELAKLFDANTNSPDALLRGALLVAALDDPDVDVDAYVQRVEAMANEISSGLDEDVDEEVRLAALDQYLFQENGFHGGRMEYYHPANSHLNRVIDEREGLPITMSILYIELGKRLRLKIEGIGLPGHFVVGHVTEKGEETKTQLIDVFNRGQKMSQEEAALMVATGGRRLIASDLEPQSTQQILTRVVRNLMGIAGNQGDTEALARYCEALVAVNPKDAEFRFLRAQARALSGRRTAAHEDADWLIDNAPGGFDVHQAIRLKQAIDAQP